MNIQTPLLVLLMCMLSLTSFSGRALLTQDSIQCLNTISNKLSSVTSQITTAAQAASTQYGCCSTCMALINTNSTSLGPTLVRIGSLIGAARTALGSAKTLNVQSAPAVVVAIGQLTGVSMNPVAGVAVDLPQLAAQLKALLQDIQSSTATPSSC